MLVSRIHLRLLANGLQSRGLKNRSNEAAQSSAFGGRPTVPSGRVMWRDWSLSTSADNATAEEPLGRWRALKRASECSTRNLSPGSCGRTVPANQSSSPHGPQHRPRIRHQDSKQDRRRPEGCRLPCSQCSSVLTLTPTSLEKTRWDSPIALRIASTRGAQKTRAPLNRRAVFLAVMHRISPYPPEAYSFRTTKRCKGHKF